MRKRSLSFYAKNEDEYNKIYKKKKTLMERKSERKSHSNKKTKENFNNNYNNNLVNKYKSFDELELDELGVN